jgi:hypothetical protein
MRVWCYPRCCLEKCPSSGQQAEALAAKRRPAEAGLKNTSLSRSERRVSTDDPDGKPLKGVSLLWGPDSNRHLDLDRDVSYQLDDPRAKLPRQFRSRVTETCLRQLHGL